MKAVILYVVNSTAFILLLLFIFSLDKSLPSPLLSPAFKGHCSFWGIARSLARSPDFVATRYESVARNASIFAHTFSSCRRYSSQYRQSVKTLSSMKHAWRCAHLPPSSTIANMGSSVGVQFSRLHWASKARRQLCTGAPSTIGPLYGFSQLRSTRDCINGAGSLFAGAGWRLAGEDAMSLLFFLPKVCVQNEATHLSAASCRHSRSRCSRCSSSDAHPAKAPSMRTIARIRCMDLSSGTVCFGRAELWRMTLALRQSDADWLVRLMGSECVPESAAV